MVVSHLENFVLFRISEKQRSLGLRHGMPGLGGQAIALQKGWEEGFP